MTRVGTVARACLAPGQRGKVLAAFSQAIYLLTEAGELFWLAAADAPLHQRCAQTPWLAGRPPAGSSFRVEDQRLTVAPGLSFDFDNAAPWSAPRLDPKRVVEITRLPARLQSFLSRLDVARAAGFGAFIPQIQARAQHESNSPAAVFADPALRFAQPFVVDMARACLDRQLSRISRNAAALVGLGAGLTPSGDDFLGGWLFAVKNLQAAYPALPIVDHGISVEAYHSRTHVISYTLLKDLAGGQAIAPLHHIVNDLLAGEPLESIDPHVSQLTQIGHSTGWDLLAGLLTGMLSLLDYFT